MPLFYQPNVTSGEHFLDGEESRHCVKVLRHSNGDAIEIIDGDGSKYTAVITNANHKKCEFNITEAIKKQHPPHYIHLAISPTKNMDRMEWLIEKIVEIGVQEVSFILCKNSERRVLKIDRLIKKAISAMKQSGQFYLPKIHELNSFDKFISDSVQEEKFIAYVDKSNQSFLHKAASAKSNYCILIGPEGDFTKEELQAAFDHQFNMVSLGPSTLRTETAGLAACHTLNLLNW
ncbi:16S rRNA (uracil(1498)-N(3))-methyltransferase [Fulvivirga sediminis]|uniref:Ribosomal RNA small subunit methyltransferase E n=1 Tax=Fulvivirga sediminis TaxID=2803949 RepID=A0A937F732_9BACT|nr:16S rRNA (uracil(1498)-N(3))-methyltransferase [Fulvivirga sediminis]MBL3655288.1 16S rRNA (uracil(1498)-N(3))-methyltransferase [Fulvivirga sediminis]